MTFETLTFEYDPNGYKPTFVCQPLVMDGFNVIRFRQNKVIDVLQRIGWIDLNLAALWQDAIPAGEFAEFWQVLGYSVSGWGGLSFIPWPAGPYFDHMAKLFSRKCDLQKPHQEKYPSPTAQPIEEKDGISRFKCNQVLKGFYDLCMIDLEQVKNWPVSKDYPEDFNQVLQMLGWPVMSKDFKSVL